MPSWPEYLDGLERWLATIRAELEQGDTAARAEPSRSAPLGAGLRPEGPLPTGESARALGLLAQLEQLTVAGERRRDEVVGSLQRLRLRRLGGGARRSAVDARL